MKLASLHNQSTPQTPPDGEPTQRLPDPGQTQRIAWTPPNTPLRLNVTSGGGPVPDLHQRRHTLRGFAAVALTILVLACLSRFRPLSKVPVVLPVPPSPVRLTTSPAYLVPTSPLPSFPSSSHSSGRVYHVAPSVPLPDNSDFGGE